MNEKTINKQEKIKKQNEKNQSCTKQTNKQTNKHELVLRALLNLEYLQSVNIILVIVSRMQQIIPVYRAKSAGQLAIITWILNFLGAAGEYFMFVLFMFVYVCLFCLCLFYVCFCLSRKVSWTTCNYYMDFELFGSCWWVFVYVCFVYVCLCLFVLFFCCLFMYFLSLSS